MTVSMKTDDILNMINSARCKLHKKFAWWPVKVPGERTVWLESYWVQYDYSLEDIGIYGAPKEPKKILDIITKEQYTIKSLQGKIVNNKLTDVSNVKFSTTPPSGAS